MRSLHRTSKPCKRTRKEFKNGSAPLAGLVLLVGDVLEPLYDFAFE